MKKIVFLGLLFAFFSCKQENVVDYPNGAIHWIYTVRAGKYDGKATEFYTNGKLKTEHYFKEGVLIDSSVFYNNKTEIVEIHFHQKKGIKKVKVFNHNSLVSEGNYFNEQKNGEWKNYDKYGKLQSTIKYINLCDKEYENQRILYDDNGNLDNKRSNFYRFKLNKTKYKIKETIECDIDYQPAIGLQSESFICISPKIERNYGNINNVKLDTVYQPNHRFNLRLSFSDRGQKNIRGFIKEFYFDKLNNRSGERIVYIDIPILVE